MANSNPSIQRFIAHLGNQLGTALTLNNGVCALYDRDNLQAAVIEWPEHSDHLILHCRLGSLQPGLGHSQRLLEMNFDIPSLRGCWLALDNGDVRLCTQRELAHLDEDSFIHLICGFVALAREARSSLRGSLV